MCLKLSKLDLSMGRLALAVVEIKNELWGAYSWIGSALRYLHNIYTEPAPDLKVYLWQVNHILGCKLLWVRIWNLLDTISPLTGLQSSLKAFWKSWLFYKGLHGHLYIISWSLMLTRTTTLAVEWMCQVAVPAIQTSIFVCLVAISIYQRIVLNLCLEVEGVF